MSAKLASALPKGNANGLDAIADALVRNPEAIRVVVALIDCSQTTTETDTGDVIPTARIRRIEAIDNPDDGRRLKQVLRRAWERRTGKDVLPLEMEDDINTAFGIDPDGTRAVES